MPDMASTGQRARKPYGLITLVAMACVAAFVGGYGYWHASAHATFAVHLVYRTIHGAAAQLRNGQLEFLDGGGAVLARATIDTRLSVVWLAHPDKGQCGPSLAKDDYQECFAAQSTWIPHWAHQVRYANLMLENCTLARHDVRLDTRRDSPWRWWLPQSQGGRLPYTRHSATLAIDTRGCR